MNQEVKELIIEKITKLLIEQDLKDKKKNIKTYVRKTTVYKSMIKLFKEYL